MHVVASTGFGSVETVWPDSHPPPQKKKKKKIGALHSEKYYFLILGIFAASMSIATVYFKTTKQCQSTQVQSKRSHDVVAYVAWLQRLVSHAWW